MPRKGREESCDSSENMDTSNSVKSTEMCSMNSYRRLEDAFKQEKKNRLQIEQLYDEAIKLSDRKSKAADNAITKLKETITKLQNESKELQYLYEQSERKLNMMQHITSIQVDILKEDEISSDLVRDNVDTFTCRVFGKANPSQDDAAIEFEIGLSENEMEYTPVHIRSDMKDTLPEYITEAIVFENQEAPLLISQIMSHVTGV